MPLHNFHIFSCSHWDLQTHFNVKKKKKHDWTLFWPKELQPNWFLKQIQRLFSWRRADVSDVTDTVPLQTFMCFPVSGTKLLCVIEVIVFFIEDTALKTDFLSHSFLQSLWFKLKLNEFSILVKKKHTHATPVLSLHSFWLSNSCCYIPRPSHGSVCSIQSGTVCVFQPYKHFKWSLCTYICKASQASGVTGCWRSEGFLSVCCVHIQTNRAAIRLSSNL